jgi:hypothetical protein
LGFVSGKILSVLILFFLLVLGNFEPGILAAHPGSGFTILRAATEEIVF